MRRPSLGRRVALALLLISFALTALFHPDPVFFGIATPDLRTF
jgi:hypothetical protein